MGKKMRSIIKIDDIVFCEQNNKIKGYKSNDFEFKLDDIVQNDSRYLDEKKIKYYLGLQYKQLQEQKKISILLGNGMTLVPSNILIPYLYKKLDQLNKLQKIITPKMKQNLLYLNRANNICSNFQPILGHKIKYDFFKSSSGRVSTNVGVITKQERHSAPHKYQLVQMDFSQFQPTLYQDYFLQLDKIQDVYRNQQGQTRQQKKDNWFKRTFSSKIEVDFTNVYGRYMKGTICYHLQALQTDSMSRLLVYLDQLLKQTDIKMRMFIFDSIIFDGKIQQIKKILNNIPWNKIFIKSKLIYYPYKLNVINNN